MKYISVLTLSLVLVGFNGKAQQFPESNVYTRNLYLINPAFTGYFTGLTGYAMAQSPLNTDFGEIRNYSIGINQSLEKQYLGVGGRMAYDKRGIFETFYTDFSVAYQLVIKRSHVISFGSDIGLVNRSYSVDQLNEFVDLEDPVLSSDYYFKTNIKLGFGVGYLSKDLEVGISLPHLIEGNEPANNFMNGYAGYRINSNQHDWIWKPNVLYTKYSDRTDRYDINILAEKTGMAWAQLGYRSTQQLVGSVGFYLQLMEFSYSLALPLQQSDLPYSNQHQVMLLVNFSKSEKKLTHILNRKNKR